MVDGFFEFLSERFGVGVGDAGDEDAVVLLENFSGDFDGLNGRFAAAINDLRKPLPDSSVMIYPGEIEILIWQGSEF